MWRETLPTIALCPILSISIHSLRVEGDGHIQTVKRHLVISIHSLRVEGDATKADRARKEALFQSTPSVWRETRPVRQRNSSIHISIHSLRVEGDNLRKTSVRVLRYFNPLPPCGGRRYRWICASFLLYISIHSLRVEGDISLHFFSDVFVGNFNPLPPCGGRHHCTLSSPPSTPFQSTPSVWRETEDSDTNG